MLMRVLALIAALAANSAVHAQTNYGSAYYLDGTFKISYGHLAINLQAAQQLGLTGRGMNIAVFDTGLDVSNPKFAGNLLTGWNIYGRNGQGERLVVRDNGWHGTLVSSIIAANKMPGLGSNTYGIAPEARIMPVQIFDENGRAAWTDRQFQTAIQQAIHGVLSPSPSHLQRGIFNNSWNSSRTLADLGNDTNWVRTNHRLMMDGWITAAGRNILNVWAAGNFAKRDPGYFATMPSIDPRLASSWITVVATDRTGHLASYSNACGIAASYCMAAPGSNILGAYTNSSGVQTLATGSGTSFAAPMVSASAALIWQYFPYLKAWQVQQILFRSANKTGIYANSAIYGQGMLDLTRAFEPIGTLRMARTTAITGSSTAITGSHISPGGAMEGPLLAALGDTTMMLMDDFDRGYDIRLSAAVAPSQPRRPATDELGRYAAAETRQGDAVLLRGTVAGEPMAFARTISPRGWTMSQGYNVRPSLAVGLPALGVIKATDLVMPDQVGNPYMDLAPDGKVWAVGCGWDDGSVTRISAFTNSWHGDPLRPSSNLPKMSGAAIEHTQRGQGWWITASLGHVDESKTLLGGSSDGVLSLGSGGAGTIFAGVEAGLALSRGWILFAGANAGHTRPRGATGGVITGVRDLLSGNARVGLIKTGVFTQGDRLGIIAGLPLSVLHGRVDLQIPVGRDDDSIYWTNRTLDLKPKTNGWTAQMFYDISAGDRWSLGAGIGVRFNSVEHGGAHSAIAMSRFRLQF
jgi:hypothetical protein